MVSPIKDCSERELFVRNGFRNPHSNLIRFMKNNDAITHKLDLDVMAPDKLGEYTKDNYGTYARIG